MSASRAEAAAFPSPFTCWRTSMRQDPTHRAKTEANRREFLKTSAFIGVSAWAAGRSWADEAIPASNLPNEKLKIACIGIGGKGESDSTQVSLHGTLLANCAIAHRRLD